MEGNKLLILRLAGILQSWDSSSKWDDRDTGEFPTKSGIVGLLGCALGLERGNPELAELNSAITMAVRADRPGTRFTDYQTITGNPLMNAAGKPKTTGNTLISRRSYLQDAIFTVFLELDAEWHNRITEALKAPKWCLYLGRKCCVPSRPILECEESVFSSLNEALKKYPVDNRNGDAVFPMNFETEQYDESLVSITRPDSLTDGNRAFAQRRIWKGQIRREDI